MSTPTTPGYQRLPGWPPPEDPHGASSFAWLYDWYADVARDGDEVVEVGVFCGRSTAYLARRLIDRGLEVRLYGVDSWVPSDAHHQFAAEMADRGGPFVAFLREAIRHVPEELAYLHIVREDSARAARIFDDSSCALVLIDGDHSYEGCARDVAAWRPKVRDGGVFAGDDFLAGFPGVIRAVEEAFAPDEVIVCGSTWVHARPDVLERLANHYRHEQARAANAARSKAAKGQHAVSRPWAGESKAKDGEGPREPSPSPNRHADVLAAGRVGR